MSAEFTTSASAMELGEVMGMQGLDFTVPSSSPRRGSSFTQAAAATNAASYPSPFLDEQKMLRFSKATAAAQTQPVSGLDLRRPNEPAFVLARNRRPFTPSQWMELEHQALIYKYLNAKAPIPSSLLISISKSFGSSDRGGWRPLYLYTSAESDPEPGRCRRTDGKKWRCSKEAITDHKYCERHINRNRHRSRKPVENQPRKTSKEAPAGSLKKAKVDDLKQATVSYWTDSLNRTMLSRDKANKQTDDNNATLLNSASRQPTLSLLSQLKQQDKTDTFGTTTVDRESITADTAQNDWCSNNQQSNRNMPSTQLHDADCLQSVLQKFSLANNEMEPQRKRYPDSMLASSTFYSSEGTHTTFLPANITQVQEDCISSSWEMPRGGPLGEILTDSKVNQGQAKKCEPKSYGWLWNFDHTT